ncbi:MAG: ATP-dependent helicase [Lachnospiraceae bacterium]|nr:ATP-dependent helicase [Lachnospiraceae bacterium]
MQYNTEQQEVILHKEGPALVLAGPGSGKTTVIAGRILALLTHYHIPPNQILVISFTRAASREIEDRFREQTATPAPVRFGTIHAIFYRILKISCPETVFSVLPENLRQQWMRELLMELFEADQAAVLSEEEQNRLQEAYRRRKEREGMLDFEDILEKSRDLFRRQPALLKHWQEQFRYIMIDEDQDTSPLQLELLKMLAGREQNLLAVGDDDQSIYGFRGADSRLMLAFPKDFPGARLYRLSACYRCSPQILSSASSFIAHNTKRYRKELKSLAMPGPRPVLHIFSEDGEEMRALLEELRRQARAGGSGEEAAILCRSRFGLRRVAAALAGAGLAFSCDEGPASDHRHWVAADVFAYLRLGRGSRSREDYLTVCNKPLRYLSRDLFREEKISRQGLLSKLWEKPRMAAQLMQLFRQLDRLGGLMPFAAVEYIRREIGYDRYLKEYAAGRGISPEPFYELLDRLQEESLLFATAAEWEGAREALLNRREKEDFRAEKKEKLALMTMHGAKGLEFDRVYLPFLNEEEIPGGRGLKKEQTEEERRLLYVAMTRARRELWMSCGARKKDGQGRPSRFLSEIDGLVLRGGN